MTENSNRTKNIDALAQTSGPSEPGRRTLLTGLLGTAAIAGPALLGTRDAKAERRRGELSGKTVFITGGARGLGFAAAEALADAGANIALYDVASGTLPHVQYPLSTKSDLEQARSRIQSRGVGCVAFTGDVRDLAAQRAAMRRTFEQFGSLDIVVANAGVSQAGAIDEFAPEEITTVLEINVGGVIKTTQAAAPFMRRQGRGRIIFISSALGRMGNALFPIYTSSKWAVIGFAKSAALTYGRSNILCNTVAPGLADTPLANNDFILRQMMPGTPKPSFKHVSDSLKRGNPIPVGHVEPSDVAKAVLFFAGAGAEKITGEVLDVSYGSLARSIA